MDMMRRSGQADLVRDLGEDTLGSYREQRILGLRAAARKSMQIEAC